MRNLSEQKVRSIVIGLCALATIRVLVFAAAFPFFNNVDEQAHVDLVIKYAGGNMPRGIEPFAGDSGLAFALFSSPEYFVKPEQYGGQYPPPNWKSDDVQKIINDEVPVWISRANHESGEPPLYYAIGGAWFDLGRAVGVHGVVLLYWVRFLNVVFAAVLVWLGYAAAKIVFPGRQFLAIATSALLTVWPQSSFYSVQGDSLSPVTFGFAFITLVQLLRSERPPNLLGLWLGLALAATCLIKTANLPLLFIVCIAVLFKTVQLARSRATQRGLFILSGFIIAVALPLGIWFAWNQHYFGDLTATKSKIEVLGWTPKAFADWWSHPIFTLTGAKDFWAELIASFWRGEFIWHRDRMATWWSDAFYWSASTVALAIALVSLAIRPRLESKNIVLWCALLSFASLVGFLVLLSIRFDFDDCAYPSREHPYFTSGRLLNAAAVPFFLLFAFAIERIATWTKREWTRWALLGLTAILTLTWQISINAPVFSSRYNFFHRAKS